MIRLVLAALLVACSATGAPLYFFGDSLTDAGNVYKATSVLRRYTFGLVPRHPTSPYVGGRFTNGPVWAEQVAHRLGQPNDAQPAGMSLGWFGRVGGPGNNYAVGGARTDEGGALGLLDFVIPTGISRQVDFHLSRNGGTGDSNGLYFLMGGGNDLRDAARIADPDQRRARAEQAADNMVSSVQKLYDAGARQFMLINAPNVGAIPESVGDGVGEAGTEASLQFNTWLDGRGEYLRTLPGLSLLTFDLFGFHNEQIANYLDVYGPDALQPCKDGPPERCEQTVYFDSIHPTARVHGILGNRIADQLLGSSQSTLLSSQAEDVHTPEPSAALLMLTGAGLLVAWRKKRLPRA